MTNLLNGKPMSMHPTRNLFAEFKGQHRIFVETGSYRGDGIHLAFSAGFKKVYSIDYYSSNVDFCAQRFDLRNKQSPYYDRIGLWDGDSSEKLRTGIFPMIKEPVMFWLDAHSQHMEDEPESPTPYPLLAELKAIEAHQIKTHTILIDDILHLTHPEITGWTRKDIEEAVRKVNPAYKIEYFANPVKNNILVACI